MPGEIPSPAAGKEAAGMKNFSLRVPDELHAKIQAMSDEINVSTHAMMMLLIKLGLKVYETDFSVTLSEKGQSARSSSRKRG